MAVLRRKRRWKYRKNNYNYIYISMYLIFFKIYVYINYLYKYKEVSTVFNNRCIAPLKISQIPLQLNEPVCLFFKRSILFYETV